MLHTGTRRYEPSAVDDAKTLPPIRPHVIELQAGINREENLRIIFERFHGAILRFFSKRGFDPEECQDLTQEAFFRVFKGIDSFRDEGPFEGWLFQIVANVYRNTIRNQSADKRRIREDSLESFLDNVIQVADTRTWAGDKKAPGPLDDFLEKERLENFARALDELPEQMRRCLVLRIHQDLKYREIAAIMRISVETVKAHLYQARQRLRNRLGSLPDAESGQPGRNDDRSR